MCDLSTAPDTPAQRVESYRRLFADALIRREHVGTAGSAIRFTFHNLPGIEERVRVIAELEQRCCAFFAFETTVAGDLVVLDVSVADDPAAQTVLSEFFQLPEHVHTDRATMQTAFTAAGLTFTRDPSTITPL